MTAHTEQIQTREAIVAHAQAAYRTFGDHPVPNPHDPLTEAHAIWAAAYARAPQSDVLEGSAHD